MVIKKGKKENQFRNFIRRNGMILLLIIIVLVMLATLLVSKKNKEKLKNKEIELEKIVLLEEREEKKNDFEINSEGQKIELQKLEEQKKDLEKNNRKFSCNDILKSGETKNGIYEIFIKNTKEKIKVYCDMKTSGGGWTLILTSREGGWNLDEVKLKNSDIVSLDFDYSILEKADFIKTIKDGKFQYRIDANKIGENGGVWEALENYSFVSTSRKNTEIKLIEKYGKWEYYTFGIEKRMPYICDAKYALLTTSVNCNSKWFGTLVAGTKSFSPAPWIHSTMKNPEIIRYWVK